MQTLNRDPNARYDYTRVIRRYLNYLRSIGIHDVTKIKPSDLAGVILSCAKEVTRGSLRTILSYTWLKKEVHIQQQKIGILLSRLLQRKWLLFYEIMF